MQSNITRAPNRIRIHSSFHSCVQRTCSMESKMIRYAINKLDQTLKNAYVIQCSDELVNFTFVQVSSATPLSKSSSIKYLCSVFGYRSQRTRHFTHIHRRNSEICILFWCCKAITFDGLYNKNAKSNRSGGYSDLCGKKTSAYWEITYNYHDSQPLSLSLTLFYSHIPFRSFSSHSEWRKNKYCATLKTDLPIRSSKNNN